MCAGKGNTGQRPAMTETVFHKIIEYFFEQGIGLDHEIIEGDRQRMGRKRERGSCGKDGFFHIIPLR